MKRPAQALKRRRARSEDREYAAKLARCVRDYLLVIHSIDHDGNVILREIRPEDLATELEVFAATGTFQSDKLPVVAYRDEIRASYKAMIAGEAPEGFVQPRLPATQAIEELCKTFNVSEETIQSALYREGKRRSSSRERVARAITPDTIDHLMRTEQPLARKRKA